MIGFYSKLKIKLVLIFLLIGSFYAFSQPNKQSAVDQARNNNSKNKNFEGSIRFVQENLEDTLYYTYYVKGRLVRLDVHEDCKNCENTDNYMIFDLDGGTITAIKPSRKMYINVPPKLYTENKELNYQVIKSNNNKKIQGYKCYQWRVKNKSQNTEVAYWVAQDNFEFFEDFLKLWNRSEKHAVYFLQIPESDGYFPLQSEERTTLREQKMTLKVLDISKKNLDPDVFAIPKEYQPYDH